MVSQMDTTSIKTRGIGNRGFTLIELMVAMALVGIVIAGIISSYTGQQEAHLSQKQVVEMQQHIRAGLYIMAREIRMAGYDPYGGSSGAGIVSAGTGASSASPLTFTLVADDDGQDNAQDTNGDGFADTADGTVDESGELKSISFYLYDSAVLGLNNLGMRIGSGNVQAIAENILPAGFSFVYLNSAGTVLAPPVNVNSIAAIQINITAQVDTGEVDHTIQNATRTVSTIVQCRNLNL
ncbi:MAG: prepilin-type N-terminal cleavage/methylation domain-containing protein [Desulfobacula sp.]|nr:prepilin-type N-terminal cleavage/methylation domain-containing protein [Desulfobacula sp.]